MNIVEVPERDVHLAKLTTGFSAGKAPEVFLLNYRYLGGFAAKQVIEPAGPRLDESEAFDARGFYPLPMKAFEYDGALQCVPQNASTWPSTTTWTRSRRRGSTPPGDSWTYERVHRGRRQADRRRHYGVGIDLSTIRAAPWVWAAGGELVDDDGQRRRSSSSTRPRAAAASSTSSRCARTAGRRPPTRPTRRASTSASSRAASAMFLSSRRDVPLLRTITDFEWDVAPFPTDVEPASVLHSDGFCMAKGDKADAAWQWIEYALGQQGQEVLAASGRSVPSLKAVAESPLFLDPTDPPANSKVFVDALTQMHQLPVTANWSEVEGRTDDILERALLRPDRARRGAGAPRRGDRRQVLSAPLDVEGVSRRYGGVEALREISLAVEPGELVAVLGASGSGKSTLLRAIAGLEPPDARARADRRRRPGARRAARRGVAMVFQTFALFPHLIVERNIAFGLRARSEPRAVIAARVRETAAALGCDGLLERRPGELSGGERQRVALARALAAGRACCCSTSRCRTSTRSCA